jgi:hypothetical protein
MTELTLTDITGRLTRLADDLDRFPAGVPCPWALGRVFNELLKVAKRDLPQDPIMRTMRLLEEAPDEADTPSSNSAVGTVRALIGQIVVAYGPSEGDPEPAKPVTRKRAPKKPAATA